MEEERTPVGLREGVRSGIVAAVERDSELRGGRTARLLAGAGVLGCLGALGMISMLSGHPYAHHPAWHLVAFTALWSGLLVVTFALVLLEVRTPSLPLARAARIGILGLGLAGICSAVCPERHFLGWWTATRAGAQFAAAGGLALSALCFGLASSFVFGAAAAVIAVGSGRRASIGPLLPGATLLLLLLPGIALQSYGTSWAVFGTWVLGTGAGGYCGVALGIAARGRLHMRKWAA